MWRLKVSTIYRDEQFDADNVMQYSCDGKYSFIGNGTGKGKKITFAEAWQGK